MSSQPPFVVIGSNCFTGSHIVEALLERGHQVVGISRSPEYDQLFLPYRKGHEAFAFEQLDLLSQFGALEALLRRLEPPVVINVAALSEVGLSNQRPVEYFETNTLATVKLCNYLRTAGYLERYVHISSAEIFGSTPGVVSEQALFNPSTPYAVSKAAADMYLMTLIKNFDFPATLIRSTNVYGKHQQLFKIIPRTAIYLRLGKTIELHGGGLSVKSFIHIRDVVGGLLLALHRGAPGTYHLSVPDDRTIAQIVRHICELMGRDFDDSTLVVGERLGQDGRYSLDCSKAQQELGWRPQVAFEDGLSEVVEWVQAHWADIQHKPLDYVHKVAA